MYPCKLDQKSWAAGGNDSIKLDRLPRYIDGAFAHIMGFDIKLALTITAGGAGTDTTGKSMCQAISELIVKDSIGTEVVRLKGWQLRMLSWLGTGELAFADPADVGTGAGAGNARTVRLRIPFCGGPRGFTFLRELKDGIQPCDRFIDGGSIDIVWGSATPFNAGTLTAGTITVTPLLLMLPEVHQGCDLRWRYLKDAAAQKFDVTLSGLKVACLALTGNADHIGYTRADAPAALYQAADPLELVASFNAYVAANSGSVLSLTAPEAIPLLMAPRGTNLAALFGFGPTRVVFDWVTTWAADQYMLVGELFDREKLVNTLKAAGVGVYKQAAVQLSKFKNKNGVGVDARTRELFNRIGPARLSVPQAP